MSTTFLRTVAKTLDPEKRVQFLLNVLGDKQFSKFNENHDEQGRFTTGDGGSATSTDYRGAHQAPTRADDFGSPATDITEMMPDFYDRPNIYTSGMETADKESVKAIMAMRDNPDAKVTIYRAVPGDVKSINQGDWVTLSRDYAERHAESNIAGDSRVLSQTVSAKDLWFDGDSINEFGYDPEGAKSIAKALFVKFNENHDEKGRFASGDSAGGSSETSGKVVGGAGKDITAHMDKIFSDPNIEKKTEAMKAEEESQGKLYGDPSLTLIAQNQGFDGLPKTVDTYAELEQMARVGDVRIVYRGLADYSGTNDGKVTFSAEQGAQEFMNGAYFSGWGYFGNGTYTTYSVESASGYAYMEEGDSKLGNGVVVAMGIPKDVIMPTEDVVKGIMKDNQFSMVPSVQGDLGRVLAAKGYQAYDAGMVQPDKTGIIVVLDRSMLTVSKETLG